MAQDHHDIARATSERQVLLTFRKRRAESELETGRRTVLSGIFTLANKLAYCHGSRHLSHLVKFKDFFTVPLRLFTRSLESFEKNQDLCSTQAGFVALTIGL